MHFISVASFMFLSTVLAAPVNEHVLQEHVDHAASATPANTVNIFIQAGTRPHHSISLSGFQESQCKDNSECVDKYGLEYGTCLDGVCYSSNGGPAPDVPEGGSNINVHHSIGLSESRDAECKNDEQCIKKYGMDYPYCVEGECSSGSGGEETYSSQDGSSISVHHSSNIVGLVEM